MSREGAGGFHPMDTRTAGVAIVENLNFRNEIPCVDLSGANIEDPIVADTVVKAFQEIGFLFVKTPDINPKLEGMYNTFRDLFYLPSEVLKKYVHPEIHYQRGFTPSRTEIGVYCQKAGPDEMALPDDKRAWFVGPEISRDHYIVKAYPDFYPKNIWPDEVPDFQTVTSELRDDLYGVGRQVLSILEKHLGYEKGFFDAITEDSPTLLRPLHYPAVTQESWENSIWACEHTDINLLTVLPASTKEGLWVEAKNGEWIRGMAPPGYTLAQAADMLGYLTGGEFHSAHHMVIAPNGVGTEERFSAALFVHARSDVLFDPKDASGNYPPITAGDLLLKRLREIGLAKKEAREQ